MATQYQIVPIGEQYLAQIMEIERETFEHPWSASLMKDSILSAHTQSWGLFDHSNKLIAFTVISVIFDEAEILDFSVAKRFQGKGFGQKLLSYIMNHLSSHYRTPSNLEVVFFDILSLNTNRIEAMILRLLHTISLMALVTTSRPCRTIECCG